MGLADALQEYHNKPLEREAKSIVAGPSFLQYLSKLFQTQISAGDIIKFESGNTSKYYMLSGTGTWDEKKQSVTLEPITLVCKVDIQF